MHPLNKSLLLFAFVIWVNVFAQRYMPPPVIKISPQGEIIGRTGQFGYQYENFSSIKICDSTGKPCSELSISMIDSSVTIKGDTMRLIKQALIYSQQEFEISLKGVVLIYDTDTSHYRNGDTVRIYTPLPVNKMELKPHYAAVHL